MHLHVPSGANGSMPPMVFDELTRMGRLKGQPFTDRLPAALCLRLKVVEMWPTHLKAERNNGPAVVAKSVRPQPVVPLVCVVDPIHQGVHYITYFPQIVELQANCWPLLMLWVQSFEVKHMCDRACM